MALAINITNQWSDGQRLHVTGTLVFSGSYAAGGELATWTNASDARQGFIGLMTQNLPDVMFIVGIAGYVYMFVRSTQKIKIMTGAAAQAALTELANGAYPGGVTGDVVEFYGVFKKF